MPEERTWRAEVPNRGLAGRVNNEPKLLSTVLSTASASFYAARAEGLSAVGHDYGDASTGSCSPDDLENNMMRISRLLDITR
jgi:hypothetical protein